MGAFFRGLGLTLGVIALVAVGLLVAALLAYIGGRIILPPMSLTAPSYEAWFGFTCIASIGGALSYVIKAGTA